MLRSRRIIGLVLGAILCSVSLRWAPEGEAKVVAFTVSNPECAAVDLAANRCAINLRDLSLTDDGTTAPYLTWAQIVIDGHVRFRMTAFFENVMYLNAGMIPGGLGVPCGTPDESGLGAEFGRAYPVGIEPLDQSGASMGSDVADVLCPAAVTTTSTTSTTSTSIPVSTTTTLPGGTCDGVPSGATLASIDCRIRALLLTVQNDGRLDRIRPGLVTPLGGAASRAEDARTACAAGGTARARRRLRQTGRRLAQTVHRLRSSARRAKLSDDVWKPLAVQAAGIRADTMTLRRSLACPAAG